MATRAPVQEKKLTKKQEELIAQHFDAQARLATAKVEEAELREQVLAIFYPDGVQHEGTQNWAMPGGWLMKIKGTTNVKVDETQLNIVQGELKALGADPETGEVATLANVIKYKPDFSVSGYKGLISGIPSEERKGQIVGILAKCLTFTPGSAGVELTKPKVAAAPKAKAAEGYNPFAEA